jgi:hypothetical protein
VLGEARAFCYSNCFIGFHIDLYRAIIPHEAKEHDKHHANTKTNIQTILNAYIPEPHPITLLGAQWLCRSLTFIFILGFIYRIIVINTIFLKYIGIVRAVYSLQLSGWHACMQMPPS